MRRVRRRETVDRVCAAQGVSRRPHTTMQSVHPGRQSRILSPPETRRSAGDTVEIRGVHLRGLWTRVPVSPDRDRVPQTNRACAAEILFRRLPRRGGVKTKPEEGEPMTGYPPHIRADPRPGRNGGEFVIIICQNCGKEFRLPECRVASQVRQTGQYRQFCSARCRGAWDRRTRR